MSHQLNLNLKIENITKFSIIDEKSTPAFEIHKGPQALLTNNVDKLLVDSSNHKNFVISRIFSVGLDEGGEHINYTLKSINTTYLKDLSNQKLSQINEKDLLNKNAYSF